ncbi:hypothetical protein NLJ89_g7978 [Agrocybe chaxingu]|uniref:Cytochrome P450 n=1 Tax=Agrocybe chaxingu TaxID=84603 RepID=A0A9W8JY83_9AGAR|nr:hypothetical protein NLJ89_g7978 [Agrocybe chaxingu]
MLQDGNDIRLLLPPLPSAAFAIAMAEMLWMSIQLGDKHRIVIAVLIAIYWVPNAKQLLSKLRHIPTVGPDTPLISYYGAYKFLVDARGIINSGMERFPNAMFKVADMFQWMVVITDPKTVDEVRKLPDNVASSSEANDEILQTEFTLGEHLSRNPYHVPIIRVQLTKALPQLLPDVHEEVVHAFQELMPVTDKWAKVTPLPTMMKIFARASNRIFVGRPLCRNPEFIELNVQYSVDVIKTGIILRLLPRFLRPWVKPLISSVDNRFEQGLKHLAPLFAARRKAREEKGASDSNKPVDFLSWLMDEAKDEEQTDWYLNSRILMVNFASIHTSSMTFTHAFLYLATYPEYVKPLRDEIEEVVRRYGWSKDALDQMYHVDSFLKESQRLTPLTNLLIQRVLVKDHLFSDGTLLPKGTTISVAAPSAHLNGEKYEDPLRFDAFRYVKMRERGDAAERKFDMVSSNIDSLGFGLGRHICPGRFFAASELKMMLAHIVVTYDVKLQQEGVRPPDLWVSSACIPNPGVQVLFRKRVAA